MSKRRNQEKRRRREAAPPAAGSTQLLGSGDVGRGARALRRVEREFEAFLPAYRRFQSVLAEFLEQPHDVELGFVAEWATFPERLLVDDIAATREAYELIQQHPRVAATTAYGKNWVPPVTPAMLGNLIEHAQPDSVPFHRQAKLNRDLHEERELRKHREATATCPRCKLRRGTWPGRDSGPACWRHVTDTEKAELSAIYDTAVSTVGCRTCQRSAGEQCADEGAALQPTDGYYSPIRTFNSRKVHLSRLDDWASDQKG